MTTNNKYDPGHLRCGLAGQVLRAVLRDAESPVANAYLTEHDAITRTMQRCPSLGPATLVARRSFSGQRTHIGFDLGRLNCQIPHAY
jgi:hypothetical protein